jgi:hypothetical protein
VDAAVYPWTIRDVPFASFPFSRFVKAEHHKYLMDSNPGIGIGDEIFITGLFRKLAGQTRITPIVRHGHIAMMPQEPIPTANYGAGFYYLVEAFSTAGLSGSPVFVNETVYFEYRGSRPRAFPENQNIARVAQAVGPTHCLGLVHGLMPIETMVELGGKADSDQKWHSGISMVVPATQILEIVNQPKLIEYEATMDEILKADMPVETALSDGSEAEEGSNKHNRDVEIQPITREQFFSDLTKATRKRGRSQQ